MGRRILVLVAAGLAAACGGSSDSGTLVSAPTTVTSTTTAAASNCATGDGVNDACACDTDAQRYCGGFYGDDWQAFCRANGYTTASWKLGLVECLGDNPVSASCKASLDRRATLNTQMMNACGRYCRGVEPKPGEEPCVDHLKSIYSTLDNACRVALDAHEGAKALRGTGPL